LTVVEVSEKADNESDRDMLIEVLPGLNCYEGRKIAETLGKDGVDSAILDEVQDFEESEGDENE
jgi:hypothetical protein